MEDLKHHLRQWIGKAIAVFVFAVGIVVSAVSLMIMWDAATSPPPADSLVQLFEWSWPAWITLPLGALLLYAAWMEAL